MKTDGLSLAAQLLTQKLELHQRGKVKLSTQELLQIHGALWREKPTAEHIMIVISNAFSFLENYESKNPGSAEHIKPFLLSFLKDAQKEFFETASTNKEGVKISNLWDGQ